MKYLKRNINLLLLVICIVLIGYNLTLMTYYETTYGSVTDKYYEKVTEYENLITNLQERERKLNETSFELTRKIEDKEKLDELYTGLSKEKEQIENALASTQNNLTITEADLSTKTSQLNSVLSEADSIANDIDNEITSVIDDISNDYNISDNDLNNYFSSLSGLADDLRTIS